MIPPVTGTPDQGLEKGRVVGPDTRGFLLSGRPLAIVDYVTGRTLGIGS